MFEKEFLHSIQKKDAHLAQALDPDDHVELDEYLFRKY